MARNRTSQADYGALLADRDEEIARLNSQLSQRIQHTEHLQARLLSTLDTLDELQAASAQDIQLVQLENERLARRLDQYNAILRNTEREKSDMSNAIMQLVTKIESCSDFSKWHAARVQLSDNLTIAPQTQIPLTASNRNNECACPHAYSPAIIRELSDALTQEQKAHALSVSESQRRISALRERLAAREAEATTHSVVCQSHSPKYVFSSGRDLNRLHGSDNEHNIAQTYTRNRLQHDVNLQFHADQSVQTELDPERENTENTSRTQDPIQIALHALDSEISYLRQGLAKLTQEKESLRNVLANELRENEVSTPSSPARFDPQPNESLISLDNEDEQSLASDYSDKNSDGVLLLEEECIRLMHTEKELRSELKKARNRELVLQDENSRFREIIENIRNDNYERSDVPSTEEEWKSPSFESHEIGFRSPAPGTIVHSVFTPNNGSEEEPEIDLSFPPIEPDNISLSNPIQFHHNYEQDSRPFSPTTNQGIIKDTGSSTSSPSSLKTPTSLDSPIDPSGIPLPPTPPIMPLEDEDTVVHDQINENLNNPSFDPPSETDILGSPLLITPQRSSEEAPYQRSEEDIARELAEARADAELRAREIAEVRGVIADLARQVVVGQGNTGPWAALLDGNDSQHEIESVDGDDHPSDF